jgi:hypothetical protein
MRTKRIYIKDYKKYNLEQFPNFNKNGSIRGMKNKYYGKNALLVICGSYIYNVSSRPDIYNAAH